MNLYEIDNCILECIDEETGEIIDLERLDALQLEKDQKIEGVCCWIKNLNAQVAALKEEEQNLAKRRKTAKNKIESLKNYMSGYLAGGKFESSKVKVSFRKSESLEVSESAVIPDDYWKPQEPKLDKAGLKAAVKNGLEIDGVELISKSNIQIK